MVGAENILGAQGGIQPLAIHLPTRSAAVLNQWLGCLPHRNTTKHLDAHGNSLHIDGVSEAPIAGDRVTDREFEAAVRAGRDRAGRSKATDLPRSALPRKRRPGRPKRADAPVIPWETIDRLLVHGEVVVDPQNGQEALRFPSLAVLAKRYGISRTLVWKYANRAKCFERRKEARAKILARTDAKVIEKVSNARAAASSDVAAIVDTFILGFRKALDEGKVRVDSAADLDRLVRLKELINGNADSRNELTGGITLEALQSRHRQLRGQVEAMSPELAGTTALVVGEGDARGGIGPEERGDDPAH